MLTRLIDRAETGLLGETPKPGNQMVALDAIRGAAVLFVFGHHAHALAGAPSFGFTIPLVNWYVAADLPFRDGHIGVDVFFVLSGFLLSMSWIKAHRDGRPRPNIREYARKRVWRIGPPYWLCMGFVVFFLASGRPGALVPETSLASFTGLRSVAAHAVFAQQLFPFSAPGFGGINGSVWTLTLEAIFYLVLPLAMFAFVGRRWVWALPATLAFGFLYHWAAWNISGPVISLLQTQWFGGAGATPDQLRFFIAAQFPMYVFEFALGIVAANLYVNGGNYQNIRVYQLLKSRIGAQVMLWLGLAIIAYNLYEGVKTPGNEAWTLRTWAAIGATLTILGGLWAGPVTQRVWRANPLRLVGVTGYTIFLWHMPVMYVLTTWTQMGIPGTFGSFARISLASVAFFIVAAPVLFVLLERPFLARAKGSSKTATTIDLSATPGSHELVQSVTTSTSARSIVSND